MEIYLNRFGTLICDGGIAVVFYNGREYRITWTGYDIFPAIHSRIAPRNAAPADRRAFNAELAATINKAIGS